MARSPKQIYILVCRDRHSDIGLSVHATREGADAVLEEFKAIYDNIKADDWKEATYGQPRWCRYVHTYDDGPRAYIEIGELKP